jgi:CheY-like chemotaxis protein
LRSEIDLGAQRPFVGDPGRLRQVLLNLLGNAVKFTSHGHVLLRVRPIALHDTDVELKFDVEDTGCGVALEAQPRLFEAFQQADASTTRRHGGTGLGLSICRLLAERMGGAVGFTTTVDVGSTFWFTARLGTQLELLAAGPARGEALVHVAPLGGRALVAEDSAINQRIALLMLENLGFTVDVVGDGAEALEALAQRDYDVVLMDCQMPVLDGYATTRALRAREHDRHTAVVALTAHAMRGDRERCMEAGMDDFVTKPVTQDALEQALRRVLRRAAGNA